MRIEDLTNRIISASASLVAVAALGTAIYQSKLMRDQAKASVWTSSSRDRSPVQQKECRVDAAGRFKA